MAATEAGLSRRQTHGIQHPGHHLVGAGGAVMTGQVAPVPLAADGEGAPMPQPVRAPPGPSSLPLPPRRPDCDTTTSISPPVARSPLPPFTPVTAAPGDVTVSPQQAFQPFLGVGAALTDSAAYVLTNYMTAAQRQALLRDLYSAVRAQLADAAGVHGLP